MEKEDLQFVSRLVRAFKAILLSLLTVSPRVVIFRRFLTPQRVKTTQASFETWNYLKLLIRN